MLPSWFVFVGSAASLVGAAHYVRDTLRDETTPNLVTWTLWGVAPLLAFIIEIQQHVGLASVMTLVLGVVPFTILAASTKNTHKIWKLGPFDYACGAISVVGLVIWLTSNQPTLGLIAQVAADSAAALPTIRKSWRDPASETAAPFFMGAFNGGITLLTLHRWTTAGALFPLAIFVADLLIGLLVWTRVGPRVRHGAEPATPEVH